MQFMTPPDPTNLSDLRRRGAKVLVYHGVADPIFSIDDTTRWWRGVKEVPVDWAPDRTRPLCPYPSVARSVHGSVETASSFYCLPGLR